MKRPIVIVGGGLAGLTLGIGLRRNGVPVTIWESSAYPRHKVCGEFISGAGLDCLDRLSLSQLLIENGARHAETVCFASPNHLCTPQRLPSPAMCLSRYELDLALSRRFQETGGSLHQNATWKQPFAPGIVRATGRRPSPVVDGWRWYGLKTHATNVSLSADLEMHLSTNAYVGLCRLNDHRINICGLFRNQPGHPNRAPGLDQLRGQPGSPLHQRLANAHFIPGSFCSVAGLELTPHSPSPEQCRIGDSMSLIPPITGNGMSIAIESAEISAAPLTAYSEGQLSWAETLVELTGRLQDPFAERLFWARPLHKLLFQSGLDTSAAVQLAHQPLALRLLFRLTR